VNNITQINCQPGQTHPSVQAVLGSDNAKLSQILGSTEMVNNEGSIDEEILQTLVVRFGIVNL
jgi:hypothetical protein